MSAILSTQNLVKKYGYKIVSNNISLTINKGDIYGFVGKNGAGKTTFMRQVLGLAFPDSGEITLFGGEPLNTARKKIGSLIEFPSIYKNCTAYENMKRMAILTGSSDKSVRKILDFVGLGNTGNKKQDSFRSVCASDLELLWLCSAIQIAILDEPINGLDPTGIMEIRDLIIRLNTEKKITFMISSHLLEELSKIATRYGFIHDGKLIEEISAVELSQKCSDRVLIVPDNPQKAAEILSKIMPPQQIHIYNKSVYLD